MEQVIGYIGTALVAWLIGKLPHASKYGKLAGESVDVIYKIRTSLADGKLTDEEVKSIAAESKELKKAYKAIKKK